MTRAKAGSKKAASKKSKDKQKAEETGSRVVSSSNMADHDESSQRSSGNGTEIIQSDGEGDQQSPPQVPPPPPLIPLDDEGEKSESTNTSAFQREASADVQILQRTSTPLGDHNQSLGQDISISPLKAGAADDANQTMNLSVDPSPRITDAQPRGANTTTRSGLDITDAGPNDSAVEKSSQRDNANQSAWDDWIDSPPNVDPSNSSVDQSRQKADAHSISEGATTRSGLDETGQTKSAAEKSSQCENDTVEERDKWLDTPPNLDLDTCDLIYLVPKHMRSDGPLQPPMENESLSTRAGKSLSTEVKAAVDAIHEILEDHKKLISKVKNPDDQLKVHQSFVNNPLVKRHYDAMMAQFKPMVEQKDQRTERTSSSLEHSYSTAPGPSRISNTRDRRPPQETWEGTYTIELVSKNVLPIDTTGLVNDAIRNESLHVNKFIPEGPNLTVVFRSRRERDTAVKALREYKYLNSHIDKYYVMNTDARSPHVFRTTVVSNQKLNTFQFMKDGKFVPEIAMDIIAGRNNKWFRSRTDIIEVQLKPSVEPRGALLQIFTTEYASRKITAGATKGINLDLIDDQLPIHQPVKVEWCFRCCDPGHRKEQCKGPIRCRYCILSHSSKSCNNSDGPFVCFRCREYNLNLKAEEMYLKKGENHTATTVDCPFYRELRKKVLANRGSSQHASPAKRRRY